MASTSAQPTRRSWFNPFAKRPDNPDLPRPVSMATTLLVVLVGLSLIAPVLLVGSSLVSLVSGRGFSALALAAGLVGVTLNVLLLMLVRRVRDGRRWAWLALLSLLALDAAAFLAAGLYRLDREGSPLVLILALLPIWLIWQLTGPRSSPARAAPGPTSGVADHPAPATAHPRRCRAVAPSTW